MSINLLRFDIDRRLLSYERQIYTTAFADSLPLAEIYAEFIQPVLKDIPTHIII